MNAHVDNTLVGPVGKEWEVQTFTIMLPLWLAPKYGRFVLLEKLGDTADSPGAVSLEYDLRCAYALNNNVVHYVDKSRCDPLPAGQSAARLVAVMHFRLARIGNEDEDADVDRWLSIERKKAKKMHAKEREG